MKKIHIIAENYKYCDNSFISIKNLLINFYNYKKENYIISESNPLINTKESNIIWLFNPDEIPKINFYKLQNFKTYLHYPIRFNQIESDLIQLSKAIQILPKARYFLLWLNSFFGELTYKNKKFKEMKIYEKIQSLVSYSIKIPKELNKLNYQFINLNINNNLSLKNIYKDPKITLLDKQRATNIYRPIHLRLENSNIF